MNSLTYQKLSRDTLKSLFSNVQTVLALNVSVTTRLNKEEFALFVQRDFMSKTKFVLLFLYVGMGSKSNLKSVILVQK